jgi:hypothetical protein
MGRDFRSIQKNDNPVAKSFFRLREPSFEKLVFFATVAGAAFALAHE